MKICNQCGIEKDLKCFANNRNQTGKQYRRAKCNTCRNKIKKQVYITFIIYQMKITVELQTI